MIKVIKHGAYKKTKCSKCGCEFTYQSEDVKYVQTDYNEWSLFIECPDCEERIKVVL